MRAALLPHGPALEAWHQWRQAEPLTGIDWRSRQFLPYVAHHLGDSIDPDAAEVARRQRRRNWADNQRDLAVLRDAIEVLRDVAPDPIVIKGAALVDEVYPAGLRAMGDADLVVGPEPYEQAIELLLDAGWEPVDRVSDRHVSRATALRSPTGRCVDLHRWAAFPRGTRLADGAIEARSVASVRFANARVLAPADTVVLAIVHGPDLSSASAIRWPVDVARLAAHHTNEPDLWDRVAESARELGAARLVGTALDWCRVDLGLPVDAEWCAALRSRPEDRWVGSEWALRRRGVPVVGRVRTYVDVSRALDQRSSPTGYVRMRGLLLRESGGVGRFATQRVRRAVATLRHFRPR